MCMLLVILYAERGRKRHKSDDKTTHAKRRALPALPSATTPLSVSALSTIRELVGSKNEAGRNSEEEEVIEDFDLPVFKLPGTPTTDGEEGATVTPESGRKRTKVRKSSSRSSVVDEDGARVEQEATTKKRKSGRQSAGESEQKRQKKKDAVKSGGSNEVGDLEKEKTDGTLKESKVVGKKICGFLSCTCI